jgi:hypothetical protein
MGSYREYQIDSATNWFQVAEQVAQSLNQVQNPVREVEAPSAFVLSGGDPKYAVNINSSTVTSLSETIVYSNESTSIRIPDKDNVLALTTNNVDEATITALVFEKLGAVELTKFIRNDTIEGINPYYNIISNLSSIKKEFDPSNLISSQKSDTSLSNAFSIKLENKIPGDK